MFPLYATTMLALESNHVIYLRLIKMAGGGSNARDEAHLMLNEKVSASIEAGATMMQGGNLATVVDRYREHVAANASRLRGV